MSKSKPKPKQHSSKSDDATVPSSNLFIHHLRLGWWLLAFFGTVGLLLESLHAFKLQYYVGVDNVTRREMWTLAHAHGTLLALVHLGYAATLRLLSASNRIPRLLASRLLTLASILMPAGFFLGGWQFYGGDPGLAILLVPLGAVALIVAAVLIGLSLKVES